MTLSTARGMCRRRRAADPAVQDAGHHQSCLSRNPRQGHWARSTKRTTLRTCNPRWMNPGAGALMNSFRPKREMRRLSYMQVQSLPPTFTTRTALNSGLSYRKLYQLRDSGELVELSRGVFRSAGAPAASFRGIASRARLVIVGRFDSGLVLLSMSPTAPPLSWPLRAVSWQCPGRPGGFGARWPAGRVRSAPRGCPRRRHRRRG